MEHLEHGSWLGLLGLGWNNLALLHPSSLPQWLEHLEHGPWLGLFGLGWNDLVLGSWLESLVLGPWLEFLD